MKRRISCTLAALLIAVFAVPDVLAEERKIGILKIFDQFVMASKAASRCVEPEEEKLRSFLTNLRIVSQRAAEEVRRRKPDWTGEQIAAVMKKRSEGLSKKVGAVIDEKGCADPRIEDLLRRFEMQAWLKFD